MIRTDRVYRFSDEPGVVWRAVTSTEDYRAWWPWLETFDAPGGFTEGATWRCVVSPPTPWTLRFTIRLADVDPGTAVFAHVSGDIVGTASIHLAKEATGSSVRLTSDLAPASPVLKAVAVFARPLVVWGHDWVLDQGVQQLRAHALPERRGRSADR